MQNTEYREGAKDNKNRIGKTFEAKKNGKT